MTVHLRDLIIVPDVSDYCCTREETISVFPSPTQTDHPRPQTRSLSNLFVHYSVCTLFFFRYHKRRKEEIKRKGNEFSSFCKKGEGVYSV